MEERFKFLYWLVGIQFLLVVVAKTIGIKDVTLITSLLSVGVGFLAIRVANRIYV